jgi:PAS domain S-box-containing protein
LIVRDPTPFHSRKRLAAEFEALRGSIADQLGDIVTTHDPDGTYRYVSAAVTEILGYEPGEIVGRSPYEYVHPEDQAKLEIVHREVLHGAPSTAAYRVRRKDNEYTWVETTLRAVSDEDAQVVKELVCSTRPITDAERVRRLSGEEYREAVERLDDVIENERINVVFQPILDLRIQEVLGYEALARFPGDPAKGPDRWFAEAWDVGLGVPLELLAVREAAKALPDLPEEMMLCVNASPPTVFADGFLEALGDGADRVKVELTEHLHVQDYEGYTTKLIPLRDAGVEVAIDDFGAGYAGLRHILSVRPEWIKLDISLTERIGENPVAHALAAALVSFSEQVGVRVIAEGIETEEELDALLELGFGYGQGFYFGMPAPLEEAIAVS